MPEPRRVARRESVDEPEPLENGGNRVTTALVYRAVDDLRRLTEAHFGTVNVRLDAMSNLPTQVESIGRVTVELANRITLVEAENDVLRGALDKVKDSPSDVRELQDELQKMKDRTMTRSAWRWNYLPAYILAFCTLAVMLYSQLHPH